MVLVYRGHLRHAKSGICTQRLARPFTCGRVERRPAAGGRPLEACTVENACEYFSQEPVESSFGRCILVLQYSTAYIYSLGGLVPSVPGIVPSQDRGGQVGGVRPDTSLSLIVFRCIGHVFCRL